ncbi:Alpha carbonic anhydrase [Elaphomyces granulatus]
MRSQLFAVFSLLSNLNFSAASCAYGTSLHRRASDEVTLPKYGYGPTDGPLAWYGLDSKNVLCARGKRQSPIDVQSAQSAPAPGDTLNVHIPVQDGTLENLGTMIEVIVNGTTTFGNETFATAQFHFHSSSEHYIDGQPYPLEMHIVHESKSTQGKILVVAIMLELETDDSTAAFDQVVSHLDAVEVPGKATTVSQLDLSAITDSVNRAKHLVYQGSLTTPPCTEGVTFVLSEQILPVKLASWSKLKEVIKVPNNRPLQNKHGEDNVLVVSARSLVEQSNPTIFPRRLELKGITFLFVVFSLLSNLNFSTASCAYGTSLHRRAVPLPAYGYGPTNGPIVWHSLDPKNILCARGTQQSPIDVQSAQSAPAPGDILNVRIPVQDATLENLGTVIEVIVNGTTTFGNETFATAQFHFHTSGEHYIDGQPSFDCTPENMSLRLTFDYIATPGKILVVAIMFELETDHSTVAFDQIVSHLNAVEVPGQSTTISLDLSTITDSVNRAKYLVYQGSLTTPPCTEGVTFVLSERILPNKHGEDNILVVSARALVEK